MSRLSLVLLLALSACAEPGSKFKYTDAVVIKGFYSKCIGHITGRLDDARYKVALRCPQGAPDAEVYIGRDELMLTSEGAAQ